MTVVTHDLETGATVVRPLTPEELAQRDIDRATAEAEQVAREAAEARAVADREALGAWLLSRDDLTDGARAAILRVLESDVSITRGIVGGNNG